MPDREEGRASSKAEAIKARLDLSSIPLIKRIERKKKLS